MEKFEIRSVRFQELRPLIKMRAEHVDLKYDGKTSYLGAFVDGEIVGCVGWMKVGNVLRYKSACVLPEYRGMGIYTALWEEREFMTKNQSEFTTAFCTSKSLGMLVSKGFKIVRKQNNGITFVKRKNTK